MDLVDIRFYAVVDNTFDNQFLKNLDYNVFDSSKSLTDNPNTKSIFCTKSMTVNEKEIEGIYNIEKKLKGIGIKKISYFECKEKQTSPKSIPKWKNPLAIIGYETGGVAILIGVTAWGSLSGDINTAIIGCSASVAGYLVYQIVTYLKRNSVKS